MAFCSNCGSQLNDGQLFCHVCGWQTDNTRQQNPPVVRDYQNANGNPYPNNAYYSNPVSNTMQPMQYNSGNSLLRQAEQSFPMGWFKFLIYFSLFAGAALNLISGFVLLTGAQYEGEAEFVYRAMPSMKTVDMLYALMCFAGGVLQIVTRFQLAAFKKMGPTLLTVCYVAGIASALIYMIWAGSILNDYAATMGLAEIYSPSASDFGSMFGSAAACVISFIYFKKRAELFCRS